MVTRQSHWPRIAVRLRPLPRLLAFTDDRIAALDDFGVRAAAIAAIGPGVGIVARLPGGTADQLARLAQRIVALAAPPMASVFVTGRSDIAAATHSGGVILRSGDLEGPVARRVAGDDRIILRSVHSIAEAEAARQEVDGFIAGTIWPSASHPGRGAQGTGFLQQVVALGLPVYAIGGVNVARSAEAREAGAFGVAAITAVWGARRPYPAAEDLVAAVSGTTTE